MKKTYYMDVWNGHKVLISKPDYKMRCGYDKKNCGCKHHSWFIYRESFMKKHGIEF